MTFDALVHRALFVARGLGFAFLVYFVTAVLRDVLGSALSGGDLVTALTDRANGRLELALAISIATMALSVLIVRWYSRTDPGADRPHPLLRLGRAWWREWVRGALLGAGLATLAVAPMILMGQTEILGVARGAFDRPLVPLMAAALLVLEAAREELGFRGPAQRELTRAVSFPVAAIFLAGSFAIVHAGNPAVGASGLAGIFLAGLALAGLARARGDLGMVCGVHAAWNIMLGMVWSLPVSGLRLDPRLLTTSSTHSLWTGGSFGAEASGPAIAVLLLFALVTWSLPAAQCDLADAAVEADDASGDAAGAPSA